MEMWVKTEEAFHNEIGIRKDAYGNPVSRSKRHYHHKNTRNYKSTRTDVPMRNRK